MKIPPVWSKEIFVDLPEKMVRNMAVTHSLAAFKENHVDKLIERTVD